MDQQNYITIIFSLNSKDTDIEKASRNTILKNICKEYALKKGLNLESLIFKYGAKEFDLNLKFDEMASSYDKNCMGITILVYNKNPLKINFHFKNEQSHTIDCYKEDKIKDIFNKYALNNSLDINNLSFKYSIIPVEMDKQQTFNQLINNNDKSNMGLLSNETNNNFDETIIENISEINIYVKEKEFQNEPQTQSQTYFKKYKKIIIIISIIIILIIIALICVFLLFKMKKSDSQHNDSKENNDIKESSDIIETNSEIIIIDSDIIITDSDIKTDKIIPKSCDKGYYIPDDDKSLQDCQKCSLEGCQKCNGTYKNNECSSCGNLKSIYYNNKIIKCNYTCETGDEEKCLTCDKDKDECISCNTGYKLVNGKFKPD